MPKRSTKRSTKSAAKPAAKPPAKPPAIKIRRWKKADIPKIVACQCAAYPDYADGGNYDARVYEMQFAAFPEGQFLAEQGGRVIGYATSLLLQLDDVPYMYEYDELTGTGTFSTHSPGGDTLYGADIAVHPDFQGRGVAGKLYEARMALLRRYNLKRMVAYGRLTGYKEHAGELTAEEYVAQVKAGTLKDPALNAHLKAGYEVMQVSLSIMRDPASLNHATLLELQNPEYDPSKRRIAASPLRRPVRKIRVCASQYLMRRIGTWQEFEDSVRFFVDAAVEYHGHFLVMPEYFTSVLVNLAPRGLDSRAAFQWVAEQGDRVAEFLNARAREHHLYIIGGSTARMVEGQLRNVAYLHTPSGRRYEQDKLHITPHEREIWGVRPGHNLRVFDSPHGRFAIQICYDIEFPEVSRILALAGAEIIFVPFSTDGPAAYNRVRFAAQARAVENSIYVVLSGNAGSLPTRDYMLHYARSAILTPSDFGFPSEGTAAEADPNVETIVVGDLDFTTLHQHRLDGSVRPLSERRPDLYTLTPRTPAEVIRVE